MTPPLTVMQLWALLAGGPIAMVLTVLVGILVNNAITKANIASLRSDIQRIEGSLTSDIQRIEGSLRSDIQRIEGSLTSDIQRIEGSLRSDIQRFEGVLGAKLDSLSLRVKAIEDQLHSTLVKR